MRGIYMLIATTSLAVAAAAVPADAKDKSPAGQSSAAQIECVKQAGGSYDAATKKWEIFAATDEGLTNKLDLLRGCMSRATGTPRGAIVIPERRLD